MSRTHRNTQHKIPGIKASDRWEFALRPEWQEERGERYGNNRKMWARLKWQERKMRRAKSRRDWMDDYE
jgi:hypothetical protein